MGSEYFNVAHTWDTMVLVHNLLAIQEVRMLKREIKAHIFYKHDLSEVSALKTAMIPMADHVHAVANGFDRGKMRQIMAGEYFRLKEAERMLNLLRRATRHARANLGDYFPMMREGILENAERLEVAIDIYWGELSHMVNEVMPTR
jgi:hypothetical protein